MGTIPWCRASNSCEYGEGGFHNATTGHRRIVRGAQVSTPLQDSWCICFLRALARRFPFRLDNLNHVHAPIPKTHDASSGELARSVKALFVVADLLESALSVRNHALKHGQSWFLEHQYHLRASGYFSDILEEDVLNFQGQLNAWSKVGGERLLSIEYDRLWDRQDEILSFFGFPVRRPRRRERSTEVYNELIPNPELFERLRDEARKLEEATATTQ